MRRGMSAFNVGAVALGFAFLYLPIVILVIYSFNASRLVAVWGGWSTRWYGELAGDAAMLESASISLASASRVFVSRRSSRRFRSRSRSSIATFASSKRTRGIAS